MPFSRIIAFYMQVYLLAETGNKGKAVDVIGAAHANADAVIQFGDASLVPVAGVLVHHVLPKKSLQIDSLVAEIKQLLTRMSKDVLVVLLDGPFMHIRASLLDALQVRTRCCMQQVILKSVAVFVCVYVLPFSSLGVHAGPTRSCH